MAIDEAIFLSFLENRSCPVLRVYGWDPPTLSLGRFQKVHEELDLARCREDHVPFVRRMTGGGVIFHDRELTYSLVCSREHLGGRTSVMDSYKGACSFLMETYGRLDLKPRFALTDERHPRSKWFCFVEREKYDILIEGKKLGGNAQRTVKGVVLQHGSIPLASCLDRGVALLSHRPQNLGAVGALEDILGREISFGELRRLVVNSFDDAFSARLSEDSLTPVEQDLAEKLRQDKYSTKEWNLYRHARDD